MLSPGWFGVAVRFRAFAQLGGRVLDVVAQRVVRVEHRIASLIAAGAPVVMKLKRFMALSLLFVIFTRQQKPSAL